MSEQKKQIAYLGLGTALYVVLGLSVNIPLIGHIQTDLGYIVYGAFLYLFGYRAIAVGTIGCVIESMLVSGWFPIGWAIGQIVIGLICAYVFSKTDKKPIHILAIVIAVFIGIAIIKTVVECALYGIPFEVKLVKDVVAWVSDTIPMIIGLYMAYRLKGKKAINRSKERGH